VYRKILSESGARTLVDSSKDIAWLYDSVRWNPSMTFRVAVTFKSPAEHVRSRRKRGLADGLDSYVRVNSLLLQSSIPFVAVDCARLTAAPEEVVAAHRRAAGMDYAVGDGDLRTVRSHHFGGNGRLEAARRAGVQREVAPDPQYFGITNEAQSVYDALGRRSLDALGEWRPVNGSEVWPPLAYWKAKAGTVPKRLRLGAHLLRRPDPAPLH
jgi:hypothetical protein